VRGYCAISFCWILAAELASWACAPGQEAKTAATILDATIARKEFMTFSPDQNRWEIAREGARSNLLRVCPSKRRNSDHSARWFSTDKSALNAVNRVELTPRILRRLLILPYSTDAIQAFSCRFRFRENLQRRKDISHDSGQIRNRKKLFHFLRSQ
jgi:hypothetical protein